MVPNRVWFIVTVILGLVSFGSLIICYLAGTDIWHESGSPDFWHGEGPSALEWRTLASGFWPICVFHIAFFIAATATIATWKKKEKS